MSKNSVVPVVGNLLPATINETTWTDIMKTADEDMDDLPVPDGVLLEEGVIPDDIADAMARAQVTPEMRSQLDPSQRRMLERLANEVRETENPFESEWNMLRAATLFGFMGIAQSVVVHTFADAAMERSGLGFRGLCGDTLDQLIEFKSESARTGKRAAPAFHHDEYAEMAYYALTFLDTLTAASEREFFVDDRPVETHRVNAFIQKLLEACYIVDSVRRVPVNIGNRIVAEVRGAIARKRPRPPAPEDGGNRNVPNTSCIGFHGEFAARISFFSDENLILDAEAWTSSENLWTTWSNCCADHCEPPGEMALFFKELVRWSGGRIHRRKKKIGALRPPGYSGVKLSNT